MRWVERGWYEKGWIEDHPEPTKGKSKRRFKNDDDNVLIAVLHCFMQLTQRKEYQHG